MPGGIGGPWGQRDYFRGERLPGAGAQAADPTSLIPSLGSPGAPAAAGQVSERMRVAYGWQGRASLIQLAGMLPPGRSLGALWGSTPGSCFLCSDPMHMDTVPPLSHTPIWAPAAPLLPLEGGCDFGLLGKVGEI